MYKEIIINKSNDKLKKSILLGFVKGIKTKGFKFLTYQPHFHQHP